MFNLSIRNKSIFYILLALSVMYIAPIILADRLYLDDLGRSLKGYTAWNNNGRPLAELVMIALNFGAPVSDISPLTQLLGVVFLVYCLCKMQENIFKSDSNLLSACVLFFCIANPFLLQNISFKYDSLTMLFAMAFIIITFASSSLNIRSFFLSTICLISSLSLYQSPFSMFLTLSLIEFLKQIITSDNLYLNVKKPILLLCSRALQFIISYFAYTLIIAKIFIYGGYNTAHSDIIIPTTTESIKKIVINAGRYHDMISQYTYNIPWLFKLYVILSVSLFIFLTIRKLVISKELPIYFKMISILVVITTPLISYAASFILLSFLKSPVYTSRTLMSFSGFLLTVSLYSVWCVNFIPRLKKPILAVVIIFCIYFTSISFTYGNALKSQKNYDAFLTYQIAYDLTHLNNKNIVNISFVGSQPYSWARKLAIYKYPFLNEIIRLYMLDYQVWNTGMLMQVGVYLKWKENLEIDNNELENIKPYIDSEHYKIKLVKDTAVVVFNSK